MRFTILCLAALASLTASAPTPTYKLEGLASRFWPHKDAPKTPNKPPRWKFGYPKIDSSILIPISTKEASSSHSDSRPWPHDSFKVFIAEPTLPPSHHHIHSKDPVTQTNSVDTLDGELIQVSEMDIAIAIPSRVGGAPCHYARLSRSRNDVAVVVLAMGFMVVVVLVEMARGLWCGAMRLCGRRGAIRLEDDEERGKGEERGLSIRAEEEVEDVTGKI